MRIHLLIVMCFFSCFIKAETWSDPFQNLRCGLCHSAMTNINQYIDTPLISSTLRVFYTYAGKSRPELEATTTLSALQQLILTPDYFCAKLMRACAHPKYTEIDLEEAVNDILGEKKHQIKGDDFIDKLYQEMRDAPQQRKVLTFVQIADIHMDSQYQEGAVADCLHGICCRASSNGGDGKIQAGLFGSLQGNCDSPPITIQSALEYIRDTIKPDVVLWTGDNSPHDDSTSSKEEVAQSFVNGTRMIQETLKDFTKVTYATFGNHDVYPNSMQDFSKESYSLTQVAPLWKLWLDNQAQATFKQHGYYSQELSLLTYHPVKVISINTQSCDQNNHYMWSSLSDPNGQLEWLSAQLEGLDQEGGYAILISHIPPDECTHQWAYRFKALLEKYQSVIRMNLYGHAHTDNFKVAMSTSNQQKAVGSLSICGSLTTWGGLSPSFCVYEVDAETFLPVNRYTYSFNMTKANAERRITWTQFTNWTHDYQMKDLSPTSHLTLAKRLQNDTALAINYNNRQGRNINPSSTCDSGCLKSTYCYAMSLDRFDNAECNGGQVFDFVNNLVDSLFIMAENPWVRVSNHSSIHSLLNP